MDGLPDGGITPGAPRVLVLGGGGFIGRHAVQALVSRGATVVVGSRHPGRLAARLPEAARECARREAKFERLTRPDDWQGLLADVDVVVNCVGILRQRGRETYRRVHHLAPAALAQACGRSGRRLVHVSALGLQGPMRSRFLRSKAEAEAALLASGADGCIVRPSLLDAETGGYGAAWIRRVARWPLHVLPADARGRIAVLDVRDLGEALAILACRPPSTGPGRMPAFELGGEERPTLEQYLAHLRESSGAAPAAVVRIPGWVARLASHACDLLHVTPFSFGHWELLRRDNAPSDNALPAILGRAPRPVVRATPAIGLAPPLPGVQRA